MANSAKLGIGLVDAAQNQKHVTVNEAFVVFDALVQLNVIDKDLTAAPGAPTEGDTYIIAAGATDVWAGHDDKIAYYDGTAWTVIQPLAGWLAMVNDEDMPYRYNGGWSSLAGIIGADYLPLVGGTMAGALRHANYTVATLPSAATAGEGATIYVSDETSGPVLAFSDGSNWLRTTDRAIVS